MSYLSAKISEFVIKRQITTQLLFDSVQGGVASLSLATQLGARLATPDELHQTCHWNVLGWCDGGKAYTCNGKLRGGKIGVAV